MTGNESINSMSNLKYIGIFDYIEGKVIMIKRMQTIYAKIYFFLNGI